MHLIFDKNFKSCFSLLYLTSAEADPVIIIKKALLKDCKEKHAI